MYFKTTHSSLRGKFGCVLFFFPLFHYCCFSALSLIESCSRRLRFWPTKTSITDQPNTFSQSHLRSHRAITGPYRCFLLSSASPSSSTHTVGQFQEYFSWHGLAAHCSTLRLSFDYFPTCLEPLVFSGCTSDCFATVWTPCKDVGRGIGKGTCERILIDCECDLPFQFDVWVVSAREKIYLYTTLISQPDCGLAKPKSAFCDDTKKKNLTP